jgi:hypothetical protein
MITRNTTNSLFDIPPAQLRSHRQAILDQSPTVHLDFISGLGIPQSQPAMVFCGIQRCFRLARCTPL